MFKLKHDRMYKLLLFLEVSVVLVIIMNLSEALVRFTNAYLAADSGGYVYNSGYDICIDGDENIDNLLARLEALPVNAYVDYVGGEINDGDDIGITLYFSLKEEIPFSLEEGSINMSENSGVYVGNSYEDSIENETIGLFEERLHVDGILAGEGFSKNTRIIAAYSLFTDYSKRQIKDFFGLNGIYYGADYAFTLHIGSDKTDLSEAEKQLEAIIRSYDNMTIKAAESDSMILENKSIVERGTSIRNILMVAALALCIVSSMQVVLIYITRKKKEIILKYAFGVKKSVIFRQIMHEAAGAVIAGIAAAVIITLIIYVGALGYSAARVFLNGAIAVLAVWIIFTGIFALIFIRVSGTEIAGELGKE